MTQRPNLPCTPPHPTQLPGTLVFDYPTVSAVTEFLAGQMLKAAAAAAAVAGDSEALGTASLSGIEAGALDDIAPSLGAPELGAARRALGVLAVVARPLMAEALPGAASGDCVHRVPLSRWDLDLAEVLQNDPFTHAAQVRRPTTRSRVCSRGHAVYLSTP